MRRRPPEPSTSTHGAGRADAEAACPCARSALPVVRDLATSRLRIAMLAPPWIPIPAPGYGGIEAVVEVLCDRLVAPAITLPCSRRRARARPPRSMRCSHGRSPRPWAKPSRKPTTSRASSPRSTTQPEPDGRSMWSTTTADSLRWRWPTACGRRWSIPSTVPSPEETRAFYEHHAHKALIVGLSRSQLALGPPAWPTRFASRIRSTWTVAIGLRQERLPPVDRPDGGG